MKKHICAALLCMIAFAMMAQLLSPAYARQRCAATWSAELMPKSSEAKAEIISGLLVEGGQTVLLSNDEQYVIEMELRSSNTNALDPISDLVIGCSIDIVKSPDNDGEYVFTINKITDPEDSDISEHYATVTWYCEGKEFCATFKYAESGEQGLNSIDEQDAPATVSAQYNEFAPVRLTVCEPVRVMMNNGNFPPMTRYMQDDKWYVLYDGGTIDLDEVIYAIDFSMTNIRQDITLNIGEYTAEVKYMPFPVLDGSKAPFIMNTDTLELPVSFMWGDLAPSVEIYRLITLNGSVQWQEYDKINVQISDNGNVQLTSNNSPAGTYKIVINRNSYNTIETNFYVCYSGIGE